MSQRNLRNQIPESDLLLFLELCDPWRDTFAASASDISWENISELSKLHGVTPFLYYRARSLGLKLPEQIEKEWLGIYLYQIAEEKKARQQIKELKEILDSKGIPFILLKGASAMLRLYPQPGLRTFVDLDILIPDDKVSRFKQTMTKAGYNALAARNSLEDEELRKFDENLDPFYKDGGLVIEPHLNILGEWGKYSTALPEIWWEKEEANIEGMTIGHLSKDHFTVHMLLHYAKHILGMGFVEIKGLIDVLYLLNSWGLEGSRIVDIAQRWGIANEILPIIATMNHYWKTDLPLTGPTIPLHLETLVLGVENSQKIYSARIPERYVKRFFRMKELPNTTSRIRYIFHLFFPTQENMCHRYNLTSKWSIVPYYFVHLVVTSRKFFSGLWYKISEQKI